MNAVDVSGLLALHDAMVERIERLERLVGDEGSAWGRGPAPLRVVGATLTQRPLPQVAAFRRDGDGWSIAFACDRFRLADSKGARYVWHLLARPGAEIHALELVAADEGRRPSAGGTVEEALARGGTGDAGELVDRRARAAYQRRLEELTVELDGAQRLNDPERAARAREEIDFLARELETTCGLAGRARCAPGPAERARQSVTKAIKAARERIALECPALERHLALTIQTGAYCSYLPDPAAPLEWRL